MATTSTGTITAVVVISFILVSSLFVTDVNLSSAVDYGKLEKNGSFYVYSQATAAARDNVNHPIIISNRKILMGVVAAAAAASINEGVEKRNVPSGPDPLHHNGIGGPRPLHHQNTSRITP